MQRTVGQVITTGKSYWFGLSLLVVFCIVSLTGCGPKNYKKDADDRVYSIIDEKWEPEYGTKANYRTNDVEPLADDIKIDNSIPPSGILTLPHAVAVATAHNREYQTQKELLYTIALDLRLQRHWVRNEFETYLFGGGAAQYESDSDGEGIALLANVGYNRLLKTGTHIATEMAMAWTDVLSGSGDSGLASILAATVTIPLLRGSDPAIVLERLTQAERDVIYQIRTFNRYRKMFVVSVVTQYYQGLELHEQIANAQAHYTELEALRDRVLKLTANGRATLTEVDRLDQEMLRTRDTLIMARKEYELFLDQFKIVLGVRPTAEFELDTSILDIWKMNGVPDLDIAQARSIEAGLKRRLDMANSADAVLDAQRAVQVTVDSLRADLQITGTVRSNSRHDPEAAVGANLDLPLDRVYEQTEYRKALLNLEQRRRDYELTADTVRLEIRDAHRMLQESAERFKVLSKGRDLAMKRLDNTSVLLQYGKDNSRRVLDAQEALYDAQDAAIEALVDYAIATLNFYRDTGVLRVRPDGMWETRPSDTIVVRGSTGGAAQRN